MISRIAIFSFLLSILFFLSACEDDNKPTPVLESKMPPYTETGANTFAFKVDGRVVVAGNKKDTDDNPIIALAIKKTNGIQFYCEGRFIANDLYEGIVFYVENITDTGSYVLSGGGSSATYIIGKTEHNNKHYATDDINIGTVSIAKFDTTNKIVSGRFTIKPKDFFGSEIKLITEGQFDVKYRTN